MKLADSWIAVWCHEGTKWVLECYGSCTSMFTKTFYSCVASSLSLVMVCNFTLGPTLRATFRSCLQVLSAVFVRLISGSKYVFRVQELGLHML